MWKEKAENMNTLNLRSLSQNKASKNKQNCYLNDRIWLKILRFEEPSFMTFVYTRQIIVHNLHPEKVSAFYYVTMSFALHVAKTTHN